jgi:glycine/D-amino acid oxidase-like deaminating enzyme
MELIEYSKRRWRTLNQLTQEDTTFMERGGISSLFLSADDVGMAEGWLDTVKSLPNGGARILTADQAAALAPGATRKLAGGIISETDGTAEPAYAAPAIALGARKHGARIYQWCAVRGIERTNDAVSGVITERGRVRASTVVLATGLWSPLVAHGVGLDLPMVQLFAQPVSVHPFNGPDYGVVSIIGKKVVGWRKQPDGGYILWQFDGITPVIPAAVAHYGQLKAAAEMMGDAMMPRFNPKTFWRWRVSQPIPLDRPGPFEATRIYEPEMRVDDADEGLTNLQAIMPVFERLSVRERWCGAMEMTTDNLPVISRVGSVPGLIIATGCLYGLTMGPGIGLIVADLATNRKPEIDIAQFRYERFTDGSKLTFHA